jgi:solute carrier family 35, member F5
MSDSNPVTDLVLAKAKASRNHALGLILISCVALLWVLSAELTQLIYGEFHFDKPFFLTYFCTSLFSLYLLGFVRASWRAVFRTIDVSTRESYDYAALAGDVDHIGQFREQLDGAPKVLDVENRSSKDAAPPPKGRKIAHAALAIGPLFFLANYTFNWALDRTSVASSSTISTTSTLFSLILGTMMGAERFSVAKLVSSLFTIAGVALISGYDSKSSNRAEGAVGDVVSVIAALLYSMYTIVLKLHCPSESDATTTAMLFGMIGGLIAIFLWPLFFLFHVVQWETFALPTARVLGLLSLNAVLGTVLSDYLWALSVSLTTPVIATLALSLTLPLSLLCDYLFRSLRFTAPYIFGVALVLGGFIVANVDEAMARRNVQ